MGAVILRWTPLMEQSIRLSRGYRAAVGGNRDHWNWNWTIGVGTVDPILAGVPYGGRLSRLPPVFRAYASIHRLLCPPAPKGRHGPSVSRDRGAAMALRGPLCGAELRQSTGDVCPAILWRTAGQFPSPSLAIGAPVRARSGREQAAGATSPLARPCT